LPERIRRVANDPAARPLPLHGERETDQVQPAAGVALQLGMSTVADGQQLGRAAGQSAVEWQCWIGAQVVPAPQLAIQGMSLLTAPPQQGAPPQSSGPSQRRA
jgi:hypothetical protein